MTAQVPFCEKHRARGFYGLGVCPQAGEITGPSRNESDPAETAREPLMWVLRAQPHRVPWIRLEPSGITDRGDPLSLSIIPGQGTMLTDLSLPP